jgi:hypothetical protein
VPIARYDELELASPVVYHAVGSETVQETVGIAAVGGSERGADGVRQGSGADVCSDQGCGLVPVPWWSLVRGRRLGPTPLERGRSVFLNGVIG